MGELPAIRCVGQWAKELSPALIVLCLNVFLGLFIPEFSLVKDWEVVYKVLSRFFRFALFLTLPLYGLLPAYPCDTLKVMITHPNRKFFLEGACIGKLCSYYGY